MYAKSEFDICKQTFMQINQVCKASEISLLTAATFVAGGSTQGFVCCHYRKKCQIILCNCKKNELLCNSKCQYNLFLFFDVLM